MRLDKFRIGTAKASPTHAYKNLKNVFIDFDERQWVTVVIGWNGTGKSNVLEALSIIFRELISPKSASRPQIDFAFELSYEIGKGSDARKIYLENDPDRSEALKIEVQRSTVPSALDEILDKRPLRISEFLKDEGNLPRFVFSYYSGESSRLKNGYAPYLSRYDKQLRSGEDPGLKRLFFALPEHSQFVLLAFLIVEARWSAVSWRSSSTSTPRPDWTRFCSSYASRPGTRETETIASGMQRASFNGSLIA